MRGHRHLPTCEIHKSGFIQNRIHEWKQVARWNSASCTKWALQGVCSGSLQTEKAWRSEGRERNQILLDSGRGTWGVSTMALFGSFVGVSIWYELLSTSAISVPACLGYQVKWWRKFRAGHWLGFDQRRVQDLHEKQIRLFFFLNCPACWILNFQTLKT